MVVRRQTRKGNTLSARNVLSIQIKVPTYVKEDKFYITDLTFASSGPAKGKCQIFAHNDQRSITGNIEGNTT